jgi:acyl-CoA synthetase (NDP forming)
MTSRRGDHHALSPAGPATGFLRPPAETIIGFSESSGPSRTLLGNLQREDCRFAGPVHLVNPARAARGEAGYVGSARDIAGPLGFVHVLLSGQTALAALRELDGDICAVAVYGGGFGDVGRDDLERELASWSADNRTGRRIPVLGPQSMGIYRFGRGVRFCGITGPAPEQARPGGVAFVSQSGALVGAFLRAAWCRGLGVGCAISIGNGRSFSFADAALAALAEDEITTVCIYVEGVTHLGDLATVGRYAARQGKVVLLAVGGESAGGRALAQSHTGTLATESRLVQGVARQYGIAMVANVEELLWGAEAIDQAGPAILEPGGGSGVALFGLTGGGVILVADALERNGVDLPQPTLRGARAIARVAGSGRTLNPLDGGAAAIGQAGSLTALTSAYAGDRRYRVVACVAGMGLPPPTPNHAHLYSALADAAARHGKAGVLVSPLPDGSSGAWDLPGLVVARGINEGAVKIRVLRDIARLGAAVGRRPAAASKRPAADRRPAAAGRRPVTASTSGGAAC